MASASFALVSISACLLCVAAEAQQAPGPPHSKLVPDATLTLYPGKPGANETRPATPSRTTPFPALPEKPGCYRTVDGKWVEVACATEAQKAAHGNVKPIVANSITSTQHAGPMIGMLGRIPNHPTTITEPFTWGSITVSQPNPPNGSETDNVNGANAFSIQVNPFYFDCSTCKAGYPYAQSEPNDNSWVQFVYTQFGTSKTAGTIDSNLCVWEFDVYVQSVTDLASGGFNKCVNPSMTDSVLPLDGQGAPTGPAEVVGYIQCPSSGTGQCTLWAVAHLPWSPSSQWWSVSTPDQLGLNGQWTNVSGGLYGVGNGSIADFTNTQLQTTVEAYTCYANPNPSSVGGPAACAVPSPLEAWSVYFRLTAADSTVSPSAESNNLTPGPATMNCGYYDCVLSYTSQ
jgi:hypothetical protein